LANSDIFVFPTRSEMMPRAVIEAMVAGKPVIASAVDGILDLIQNKKTGILVQPGNVDELAEAICELIEHPSLANELGLAGQKYVLDFCSPERVGRLFRDFYHTTLNPKYRN
jgi:glycosyltransferase involved in cell wall biosynthesis